MFGAEILPMMLLIAGVILMMIEVIMPGFGAPGIAGFLLVFVGVNLLELGFFVSLIYLTIALILSFILGVLIASWLNRSGRLKKIILKSKDGLDSKDNLDFYLGKEGITITKLRPSGFVMIDDEKLDVVTSGEYIDQGQKVRVLLVEGRKIIVRRV